MYEYRHSHINYSRDYVILIWYLVLQYSYLEIESIQRYSIYCIPGKSRQIWGKIGWLVVLRINVDLAIFQPYLDLEAGDNQSLKIQVARSGIETRSSCSASQELNHSATAAPLIGERITGFMDSCLSFGHYTRKWDGAGLAVPLPTRSIFPCTPSLSGQGDIGDNSYH